MADQSEFLVTCPYDKSHRIINKRFQVHLVKCRKNYPLMAVKICPYNQTHHIQEAEFEMHIRECETSAKVLKEMFFFNNSEEKVEIPAPLKLMDDKIKYAEEDWDTIVTEGYDPMKGIENKPVLRGLIGESKSKKRQFREQERKRHQALNNGNGTLDDTFSSACSSASSRYPVGYTKSPAAPSVRPMKTKSPAPPVRPMKTKSVALEPSSFDAGSEIASNVSINSSFNNTSRVYREPKQPSPLARKITAETSMMVNPEDFVNLSGKRDDTFAPADITLDDTFSQTFAQKVSLNETNNQNSTLQSLTLSNAEEETDDEENPQMLKELQRIQNEKRRLDAEERELKMKLDKSMGSTANNSLGNKSQSMLGNNFQFFPRDNSPSMVSNSSAASKVPPATTLRRPKVASLLGQQGSSNASLLHSRDTSPSKLSTTSSTATLGQCSTASSFGKTFAVATAGERPTLRRPRTVSQALFSSSSSLIN